MVNIQHPKNSTFLELSVGSFILILFFRNTRHHSVEANNTTSDEAID